MANPNKYQIGGGHYMRREIQHWDLALKLNLDYFQGVITKYLDRCHAKHKSPIEDLKKALHYLDKYRSAPQAYLIPTYTEEQFLLIEKYISQLLNSELRKDAIRAIVYKRLPQAKQAIEQILEIENGSSNHNEEE